MSKSSLVTRSMAALAGVAMLGVAMSPASAFTLAGSSLERAAIGANIDKVWWRHGWHYGWHGGWRHGGWRHCWINQWGHRVCRW